MNRDLGLRGGGDEQLSSELKIRADRNKKVVEMLGYFLEPEENEPSLWENPQNEMYFEFAALFGPKMVGHGRWKNCKLRKTYGSLVSVPMEAFVFLALENGIAVWRQQWRRKHGIMEEGDNVKQRYKYQPLQGEKEESVGTWTDEGKIRFNDICRGISDMRNRAEGGVVPGSSWTRVQEIWKQKLRERGVEDGSIKNLKRRRNGHEDDTNQGSHAGEVRKRPVVVDNYLTMV